MTNNSIPDPISTLYINLAHIDAISDLLYHAGSEGDVSALDQHTIMNAGSNIQSMVNECNEAVGQVVEQPAKTVSQPNDTSGPTTLRDEKVKNKNLNNRISNIDLRLNQILELVIPAQDETDHNVKDNFLGAIKDSALIAQTYTRGGSS